MHLVYDTLTGEERELLQEYARRLQPSVEQLAAEWASAWMEAVPSQGVDPDAYRQVVEFLTREAVCAVFQFLRAGDFEGLYQFQYDNNREGARRQLGKGAVLVFNQHELHRAARAGQPVIARWINRAFGEDSLLATRVHLAQEKLGSQLNTILSEAYSDEREGHLEALGEELRRALEVSERLRQVGQAITQSLDIEPVLDLALKTATELLDGDSAGLTMVSPDGNTHRLVSMYGSSDDYPREWRPVEGSLSGWVFQNNRPARSGRRSCAQLTEEAQNRIRSLGIEAYVVVPLRVGGKPIGALGIQRHTPRTFTSNDEAVLQRLADVLAIAIENSRIHGEVRQALAAAERANRAKSEFVAAVSHEIRAPLSALIGYVDLLREETFGPLQPEQHEVVERLEVITHSTLRLTNDLLDHARMEAGGLPVRVMAAPVQPVLDEVQDTARLAIGERPVKFSIRTDPQVSQVRADPDRLRQILVNLVTNAAKFTCRGAIAVEVAARAGQVEFTVHDTGKGIPPEEQPRVFELFYRSSPSNNGGAGIGLFLSRQLAHLMGGDLTVDSEVGKGSTFTLTLPAA